MFLILICLPEYVSCRSFDSALCAVNLYLFDSFQENRTDKK